MCILGQNIVCNAVGLPLPHTERSVTGRIAAMLGIESIGQNLALIPVHCAEVQVVQMSPL